MYNYIRKLMKINLNSVLLYILTILYVYRGFLRLIRSIYRFIVIFLLIKYFDYCK